MADAKKEPSAPEPSPVEQAIAYEEAIAAEAKEIRGGDEFLNGAMLNRLYPLLKRPIPPAFIETVGAVKGKPYSSTGVRSVQVQIDRLNNVLGLSNWQDNYSYEDDGRVCQVVVSVLGPPGGDSPNGRTVLMQRSSWGGVDHASTRGNFYKGSYTNAAKVAIARLGPGHEIYVGVPDLDPDVSKEMAQDRSGQKDEEPKAKKIGEQQVEELKTLWRNSGVDENAWKTFLASRRRKDVKNFDTDDLAAAITFLSVAADEKKKDDE